MRPKRYANVPCSFESDVDAHKEMTLDDFAIAHEKTTCSCVAQCVSIAPAFADNNTSIIASWRMRLKGRAASGASRFNTRFGIGCLKTASVKMPQLEG